VLLNWRINIRRDLKDTKMKPKVLVLSGYGINCERETQFAFELAGAEAEIVHVNDIINGEKNLKDYQIMAFPGGFSYGDDTGSGNAMANKIRLNLWEDLMQFIKSGKLIIGICNGFQVLVNLGLLPALKGEYGQRKAALAFNNSARYECRWVHLKNQSSKCVFVKNIDKLYVPVAHGEGKFFVDDSVLEELKRNDQIVFSYTLPNGEAAGGEFPFNPNGALQDIAGICDETGRILGMMPHPERAIFSANFPHFQRLKEKAKRNGTEVSEHYEPAVDIFRNAVEYVKKELGNEGLTYADAGVNIDLGDDTSQILYNAAKQTWQNRDGLIGEVIVPFDDFSGLRMIDTSGLPNGTMMCLGFDGVGTKVELAERVNDYSTIAFDLLAMVCDDAVVRGGEPVLVGSILDVNTLGKEGQDYTDQVRQLAKGYVEGARDANVAIINGEIAELPGRVGGYGGFNLNWGAGLVWFANKNKLFTGNEINVGDKIVALREKGFRSNGLSLVRKIFGQLGDEWHNIEFNGSTLGKAVLTPSKIYSKAVVDMYGRINENGRARVHGVAHITGGGVPGKLGRTLKSSGFGAELTNLFEPAAVMLHCQKLGNVNDIEAYKTWNMGQGMLIVTPDPEEVIRVALEHGIDAKVAGEVVERSGIRIRSKGAFSSGELSF